MLILLLYYLKKMHDTFIKSNKKGTEQSNNRKALFRLQSLIFYSLRKKAQRHDDKNISKNINS